MAGVTARPAPTRTTDQSSSSHCHVAVRLILTFGSDLVGAGRMMEEGAGSEKEAGGETGRRCESHLSSGPYEIGGKEASMNSPARTLLRQ